MLGYFNVMADGFLDALNGTAMLGAFHQVKDTCAIIFFTTKLPALCWTHHGSRRIEDTASVFLNWCKENNIITEGYFLSEYQGHGVCYYIQLPTADDQMLFKLRWL
jgi:hypothetical protein